jgi:hypothetical protein
MPTEKIHEAINLLQSEIQELRVLMQEWDRLSANRSEALQGGCQENSSSVSEDRRVNKSHRLPALDDQLSHDLSGVERGPGHRRGAPDSVFDLGR